MKTRIFDTSTAKGIKQAEKFQSKMYNIYNTVTVHTIGIDKIKIEGK